MMTPGPRRVTAVVLSLLLAHVAWVGNRSACDLAAHDHPQPAAMADMNMSAMDMAGMLRPGLNPGDTAGSSEDPHAPCSLPWATDGCRSAATCAPTALASLVPVLSVPQAAPFSVAAAGDVMPLSLTLVPELPPPRA